MVDRIGYTASHTALFSIPFVGNFLQVGCIANKIYAVMRAHRQGRHQEEIQKRQELEHLLVAGIASSLISLITHLALGILNPVHLVLGIPLALMSIGGSTLFLIVTRAQKDPLQL